MNTAQLKTARTILAAALTCGLIAQAAATGQPAEMLPRGDDLMRKFVARSQQEDKQRLDERYGFIERRIHDELDKNGNVKEHSDRGYQKIELDGTGYLRWIAKDGKPLTGDEIKIQHDNEQKFIEERKKKKEKAPGEDSVKMDEQFLSAFHFEAIGKELVNGRPAYIITVLPKSPGPSGRNSAEKLFMHMQGKVWVDVQDYGLAKVDVHLTEPTSFYGVLGTVRQLDLELSRVFFDNSAWMPQSTKFSLEARKLLTTTRIRQSSQYGDYKKLGK